MNDKCPFCSSVKKYDMNWDAHYCENCNKWLEDICNDPSCYFCPQRPEFPLKNASKKPKTCHLKTLSAKE